MLVVRSVADEINENHHIQITSRRGAIVIEGPDKDWVAEQARWALGQLPDTGGGSVGFSVESGGTAQTERAQPNGPDGWYLGQGGPDV